VVLSCHVYLPVLLHSGLLVSSTLVAAYSRLYVNQSSGQLLASFKPDQSWLLDQV
jgi:hypothetical protein